MKWQIKTKRKRNLSNLLGADGSDMSEETEQNWKAERIVEYARLENEIALQMNELNTDPELNKLMKEQAKLNDIIALAKGIYAKNIETAQQQQKGIKAELVNSWGDTEDKTFKCDAGTATLRRDRSLKVLSKTKLVEFLATLNKLPDFIKTFDVTKLRKIKDAGLLGDEIASYEENPSVVIKITEVEQ